MTSWVAGYTLIHTQTYNYTWMYKYYAFTESATLILINKLFWIIIV